MRDRRVTDELVLADRGCATNSSASTTTPPRPFPAVSPLLRPVTPFSHGGGTPLTESFPHTAEMQDLMDMSQIDLDDLLEGDVDEDELELPPSFRGTAHFTRLNNKLQTSSMPDLFDKLNLRDASSRGQEHLSEDDGILF